MFNPRFIGVLKHPGYNGFDPLSATIATTIAAEAAAPAIASTLASEAIIPSILTGIGGIGAADTAAIAAALGGAGAGTVGSTLASAGLADLASAPLAANALNITGMGGQLASNVPSVLQGIGGIGATDAATLAAAEAANAVPGTLTSQMASNPFPSIAGTPGTDIATGSLNYNPAVQANEITGQAYDVTQGVNPSGQVNLAVNPETSGYNAVGGVGNSSIGPQGQGLNLSPDQLSKAIPSQATSDIMAPSFGKFTQGATEAQGLLSKMGLGGLEDFYNKNKLLSNVAMSAGMGMLGSKQPGVAPIKKYDGRLNRYHLADNFQAVTPTPNVYKPSYTQNAAEGGIVGFAEGGNTGPFNNINTSTGPFNNINTPTGAFSETFKNNSSVANTKTGNYDPSSYTGPRFVGQNRGGILGMFLDLGGKEPTVDNQSVYNRPKIYKAAYAEPTQTQTNVPVPAAQADPGLWNESMYSPMFAEGGIASYQLGGDVNFNYPQADQHPNQFANQNQLPTAAMGVTKFEPRTDAMTGQMIGFADGGVASYAFGDLVEQEQEKKSKLSNPLLEYYSRHTKAKEMMAKPDVGIFHDSDPDTRNLDAQQAALVRLRKQFGYAQMKQPKTNLKEMPSLGTLPGAQHQVQEAANGGIMGYSLGGYASGGNPRLLRGPGDGMSDNIPATIANRQPARLADGEFVVPADVVSHLGNGSTEAGAKHLHTMMNKVRVARTGKKKQGTQINPNKFLPA
jgi:hypothetical protein